MGYTCDSNDGGLVVGRHLRRQRREISQVDKELGRPILGLGPTRLRLEYKVAVTVVTGLIVSRDLTIRQGLFTLAQRLSQSHMPNALLY